MEPWGCLAPWFPQKAEPGFLFRRHCSFVHVRAKHLCSSEGGAEGPRFLFLTASPPHPIHHPFLCPGLSPLLPPPHPLHGQDPPFLCPSPCLLPYVVLGPSRQWRTGEGMSEDIEPGKKLASPRQGCMGTLLTPKCSSEKPA